LRIVKVFWGLDSNLAYRRHFPAINWLTSYSLYDLGKWFNANINEKWTEYKGRLMKLLNDEAELDEIVKLVGMDALSAPDRLKLEAARSIREDFLHQDAFHEDDTYTSLDKQFLLMDLVLKFYDVSLENLEKVSIDDLVKLPVRERIGRFKYVKKDMIKKEHENILEQLNKEIKELVQREGA